MQEKARLVVVLLVIGFSAAMLYYTKAVDASFSSAVNLSNTTGESYRAQIAVSNNSVYVVWQDKTPGNDEILFARSTDSGGSFSTAVNLSNNTGTSAFPRIAASNNNVYVVWYDYTIGNSEILFARSTDSGATFEGTINLSNSTGTSYNPWIAVSESNVYVVWNDSPAGRSGTLKGNEDSFDITFGDSEILFARSRDNGATFESLNLSNSPSGFSWNPRIAVSGSNVYVVWNEEIQQNTEILFARSVDAGASFSNAVNLSNTPGESLDAEIVISANNVYVVWNDKTPGNTDVFFARSVDDGSSFSSVINLSNNSGESLIHRDAQIAASNNNVYVVWYDYTIGNSEILFTRSTDSGGSFSDALNLSNNAGTSEFPQISVSGSNVYVIWNDSALGNTEIFFTRSTDNGTSFESVINLSNTSGESLLFILGPQIVVSGNIVHVVWEDKTLGNGDLFLATFIEDNIAVDETMTLTTDNGSIKVEITSHRQILKTEEPVRFTLKFLNPITSDPLQHVNYSFMITDENGNNILNKANLHAYEGVDTQSVTFSNTGSFRLTIEVAGLGINMPYDERHSGTASATLTVVPEFPLNILAIMAVVVGTSIAITRLSSQASPQ